MDRPTIDKYYLNIALEVSKRSTCFRKHYGAVLVNNNEILSTGYNNPPRGEPHCTICTKQTHGKDLNAYYSCPSVHAEMNCLISASRNEMLGSTLYLAGFNAQTGEELNNVQPCEVCLKLIKNAGISRIITNQGIIFERDLNNILRSTKND